MVIFELDEDTVLTIAERKQLDAAKNCQLYTMKIPLN